jgi:hypothetical protein
MTPKHEARHRDRELPVNCHDLIVRSTRLALDLRRPGAQLGDRHLGITFLGTAAREYRFVGSH